ncbi:RING finger protein 10 [Punica granatum]|uniref:RING finger protein 10 n=1 Tax=Punica granatum TaxID=22663 RepID=A0A6P8CKZ6_PUNGR|nr:RING finger protein 10 [Punica granatum]
MSILPTEAQGFSSSSYPQPQSPNTNANHGNPLSPHPHSPLSQSPPSLSGQVPGPVAPTAEGSGGSSQKVRQSASSNGKKFGSSKSRGNISGATVPSRSQRGTGSTDSQTSSMQPTGRKSQAISGNHLLNFHYDPITRSHPRPPPPRRAQKIKPYNRDLFLQANYKFVVLESENYSPESMDPDKMLQWEDIICVKYSTTSMVQCPICLEYPLCPQITSCGHIFCFPCILQYLLMGEDSHKGECFKRCPLCFVMISRKDLYTLSIEIVKQYSVGDSIEFMLLTRQKDSFAPTPKSKDGTSPEHKVDENDMFSKFTFTSDVDLSARRAIADLDGWLARAESGLVDDIEKLPYVSAAMEVLEKRKKYWNEHRISDGNKSCKYFSSQTECHVLPLGGGADNTEECELKSRMLSTNGNDLNKMRESRQDRSELASSVDHISDAGQSMGQKDPSLPSNGDSQISERRASGPGDTKENDSYNFYQAVDGQNIILHPLNMKCLLHHYGSYDMLPHRISGRILEMETVTQSEAIRKRYRYLSHFSLTTTFQLCEIDLSELLPSEALLPFVDEIKKREKQRKQLAKKERREKIKAEAAAEIPMSIQFDVGQSSRVSPSTYSMDDFQALGGASVLSTSPPVVGERTTFSNVTRLGYAAGHDSPALKNEEDSSRNEGNVKVESTGSNGSRGQSTPSFANMMSRARTVETLEGSKKRTEMGKKGKKSTQVLLSTAGGRRY